MIELINNLEIFENTLLNLNIEKLDWVLRLFLEPASAAAIFVAAVVVTIVVSKIIRACGENDDDKNNDKNKKKNRRITKEEVQKFHQEMQKILKKYNSKS